MVFMVFVPVALISFIYVAAINPSMAKCGVIDYDNTEFTQSVIKSLEGKCEIKYIKEEDIQRKIFGQTLDMAVIIDKGFTTGIINKEDVKLRVLNLQETNISLPLKLSLDSFVNAAANVAAYAGGDSSKFYEGMKSYESGAFKTEFKKIDRTGAENGKTRAQMGFLVMGMLFLSTMAGMIMIEDKEKRVYYRVISGPIKVSKYMMQSLISFYTISVLQVVLIFFFMYVILKVDFGAAMGPMIVVSLIFSLFCVALGVAINTISKDQRQSAVIMSLLLSPMCMLGGAWWPMEFMPKLLQKIAQFVPVTWVMKAYEKLINGGTLINTINEILVILAFTALFLLLASWKRVDVAK